MEPSYYPQISPSRSHSRLSLPPSLSPPLPLCIPRSDLNECLNSQACPEDGFCVNSVGSYNCRHCDSGYRMSPTGQCEGTGSALQRFGFYLESFRGRRIRGGFMGRQGHERERQREGDRKRCTAVCHKPVQLVALCMSKMFPKNRNQLNNIDLESLCKLAYETLPL